MNRPLLIIHGGKDKLIPNSKEQVDYIMDWAIGEKELKFYPDGEHCCVNYMDEILPYVVDWFKKHYASDFGNMGISKTHKIDRLYPDGRIHLKGIDFYFPPEYLQKSKSK